MHGIDNDKETVHFLGFINMRYSLLQC